MSLVNMYEKLSVLFLSVLMLYTTSRFYKMSKEIWRLSCAGDIIVFFQMFRRVFVDSQKKKRCGGIYLSEKHALLFQMQWLYTRYNNWG